MRKHLGILFVIVLICTLAVLMPGSVFAADYSGQCGDDIYWTLSEDGTMTLSGSGYMWEFADEYGDYRDQIRLLVVEEGIKSLGVNSFANCSSLEKVILPEGFQCIHRQAFSDCTALKEINIPSTVTEILNHAFDHCTSLYEIDLSATENLFIADYAFYFSGLETVTIPDSVRSIGFNSFMSCGNLKTVDLGKGLTSIPYRAFAYCTRLEEVKGGEGVTSVYFNSFTDCPCVNVSDLKLQTVNTWLLSGSNKAERITVPENINVIAQYAFTGYDRLYEVVFLGDLPYVGYSAFNGVDVAVYPAGNDTWSEHAYKSLDTIRICIPSDHVHDYSVETVAPSLFNPGCDLHCCTVCGYYYLDSYKDSVLPIDVNEWYLLLNVNNRRLSDGLNPLTMTAAMQRFAEIRGSESVFRVMNGHTRPDGSSYRTVAQEIGLTGYTMLRENLYWSGRTTPGVNHKEPFTSWMNSDTHREAILMPSLTVIGIDFKLRQPSDAEDYSESWVQNFAAGGTYNSFRMVVQTGLTVAKGTPVEKLPVYAELNNTAFGTCWLPILPAYCSGYDSEVLGTQTVTVSVMGFTDSFEVTVVEKEHDYEKTRTVYPACTRPGYCVYTCKDCGDSYQSDYLMPIGHTFGEWTAAGGGLQSRKCTACGETESRTAPKESPFTDVKEKDFFFDPVLWAVENGVTSGLSATEFGPAAGCTRAQVVTFLWRAAGKPAPESDVNPFKDVAEGQYYYDAVLWAVENGITTGLSADTFGPNANCNRGQIVTFLWRAMGKPAPASSNNPFGDVSEKQYYYDAVLWAVEKGITTGLSSDSFGPNSTCTRGQIVTFLYRAYK